MQTEAESENENPGALAGATGSYVKNIEVSDQNTFNRLQTATSLACAIAACDPDDRVPFLERLLEELRPGWPQVPFLCGLMEEAGFWADRASRVELKAYALACYQRMSPADQVAFLGYVQTEAA